MINLTREGVSLRVCREQGAERVKIVQRVSREQGAESESEASTERVSREQGAERERE